MSNEEKKTRKIRVRGTGCFDPADNSFDFTPFNEGESSQKDVRNCLGGGKTWVTTGRDPSRMLSLKAKESSPDQYAELVKQFNILTRDLKPSKPVEPPKEQRVVNEKGLMCFLNEQMGEMTFTGTIDLTRHLCDWQSELLRLVQLIVRRLPASNEFNKIINTLKKK